MPPVTCYLLRRLAFYLLPATCYGASPYLLRRLALLPVTCYLPRRFALPATAIRLSLCNNHLLLISNPSINNQLIDVIAIAKDSTRDFDLTLSEGADEL